MACSSFTFLLVLSSTVLQYLLPLFTLCCISYFNLNFGLELGMFFYLRIPKELQIIDFPVAAFGWTCVQVSLALSLRLDGCWRRGGVPHI